LQLAVGHRLEGPGTGLKPLSAVTVRGLGAQVRDSDGRLDDVTAGLVVLDDTTAGRSVSQDRTQKVLNLMDGLRAGIRENGWRPAGAGASRLVSRGWPIRCVGGSLAGERLVPA
jgi:hypothetical protein